MGDWPLHSWGSRVKGYPNGGLAAANDYWLFAQTSATQHTKGSYYELIDSTPFAGFLHIMSMEEGQYRFMFDVAVGAAGSEEVILSNMINQSQRKYQTTEITLPTLIPAGTRVSVRAQTDYASGARNPVFNCNLIAADGPQRPHHIGSRMHTIGVTTSTTTGTQLDPGATANTWGSIAQLSTGIPYSYRGFYLFRNNMAVTARVTANMHVRIMVGAFASEIPIVTNHQFASHSSADYTSPLGTPYFGIPIPAGTRVTAQARCTSTVVGTRRIEIALYGVTH